MARLSLSRLTVAVLDCRARSAESNRCHLLVQSLAPTGNDRCRMARCRFLETAGEWQSCQQPDEQSTTLATPTHFRFGTLANQTRSSSGTTKVLLSILSRGLATNQSYVDHAARFRRILDVQSRRRRRLCRVGSATAATTTTPTRIARPPFTTGSFETPCHCRTAHHGATGRIAAVHSTGSRRRRAVLPNALHRRAAIGVWGPGGRFQYDECH
mmetsp:Transcript_23013/g.64045  ORF Transcript_23013/g.64045 Transcript_23013/m.64045 type:complete len:213 (+) Transcript_23013:549-1187(+)